MWERQKQIMLSTLLNEDTRQRNYERKRRIPTNIWRIGHYHTAAHKCECLADISEHFEGSLRDKILKQIAKDKLPKHLEEK